MHWFGSPLTFNPSLVEYSRLVMYSFGFQQAFERGIEPGDQLFFKKVGVYTSRFMYATVEITLPSV